jgi:hypothetical protein
MLSEKQLKMIRDYADDNMFNGVILGRRQDLEILFTNIIAIENEAKSLAGQQVGREGAVRWRPYPKEKPEQPQFCLTRMDVEPDMGPRTDVCHYMPGDIPGQTGGWGTPLVYPWANCKVTHWLPAESIPPPPAKEEG